LAATTPLRRQYLDIKKRYADAIVFFRLGDFYEMFDDDAVIASEILQIVLTGREMGKGTRVSMCGVPYHAAETYAARLLDAGHKVAICDQVGEPGSGLVERAVTQVITPGTKVEDGMLRPERNNYLAAVVAVEDRLGLAFADITTGEFAGASFAGEDQLARLRRELARLDAAEVLVPDALLGELSGGGAHVSAADGWIPAEGAATAILDRTIGTDGGPAGLDAAATGAAATLVAYVAANQSQALHVLTSIHAHPVGDFMEIDDFTWRNLDIDRSADADGAACLLDIIDKTRTPMGSRLLRARIGLPLLDVAAIESRLDGVEWLLGDGKLRSDLGDELRAIGDLERTVIRIRRESVRAQDLLGLGRMLGRVATLADTLTAASGLAESHLRAPDPCVDVAAFLERALEPNGDRVIRAGYDAKLDELYDTATNARAWLATYEQRLRDETGIKALKIGYNRVFGYYVEVSRRYLDGVPDWFEPRQSLTNSQRYVTPELKEHEVAVLTAQDRAGELEQSLYAAVVASLGAHVDALLAAAGAVARLDVALAGSELAGAQGYVRPEFVEDGVLEIEGGRHPVVEAAGGERFVPNDCRLGGDHGQIMILTGPNMAGKSTFLRQVALIALMAQIGGFVPATTARLPVFDRIFTRVGARDDLAGGMSTFMVEMSEVAAILSRATENSLIVLDEIGRGTSTYDGLSIAQAVIEYLHNHPRLRAKTIFATHYHELTALAERYPRVRNFNVAVSEQNGNVVFLRRITPGGSDRSYGIYVGRLAGLPDAVTRRAEEILATLEAESGAPNRAQMSLLPPERHPLLDELEKLELEGTSPLTALNKLYEWRRMLDE
jgi:DNA mismatch repair protein MutS